jgi:hypothetical protein
MAGQEKAALFTKEIQGAVFFIAIENSRFGPISDPSRGK